MFYATTKNTRRWGATRLPNWFEAVVGYVLFAVVMYILAVWGSGAGDTLRLVAFMVAFFILIDVVCAVARWHWRRQEQQHRADENTPPTNRWP